jgi:hypothetical protein
MLTDERDVGQFLDETSDYVSDVTGRDFDAHTALVGRLDICHNFNVGEWNIVPHIYAVASLSLPRMNRMQVNDTTVFFQNKSKKHSKKHRLTEKLMLYGKLRQMKEDGNATLEELKAANGVLRLEHRFDGDGVRRLSRDYDRNRHADCLLVSEIARDVLRNDLERTNLNKPKVAADDRIDTLLKALPKKRDTGVAVQRLAGFLSLLDHYGEDFWHIPELGYSRSTYYEYARQCREADVWRRNEHPAKLQPLRLVWDADAQKRANLPLSNTVSSSPAYRTS